MVFPGRGPRAFPFSNTTDLAPVLTKKTRLLRNVVIDAFSSCSPMEVSPSSYPLCELPKPSLWARRDCGVRDSPSRGDGIEGVPPRSSQFVPGLATDEFPHHLSSTISLTTATRTPPPNFPGSSATPTGLLDDVFDIRRRRKLPAPTIASIPSMVGIGNW